MPWGILTKIKSALAIIRSHIMAKAKFFFIFLVVHGWYRAQQRWYKSN